MDALFSHRFTEQTRPLLHLLKQTDELILDDFTMNPSTIDAYKSRDITVAHRSNVLTNDLPELNFSSQLGAMTGDLIIVFDDGTLVRAKKEKQRREDEKKLNSLPIWHQVSTVTGDLMVETLGKDNKKKVENEDEDVIKLDPEVQHEVQSCAYPISCK